MKETKEKVLKVLAFLEQTGKGSPFVLANKRFVAENLRLPVSDIEKAIRFGEENGVLFYDNESQCFALPSALKNVLKHFRDGAKRRKLCAEFYRIMRDSLSGEIVIPLSNGKEYRIPQHHIFEWMKLYPEQNVILEVMRYQNFVRHCAIHRPATPEKVYEAILARLERAESQKLALMLGKLPGNHDASPNHKQSNGHSMALQAFPNMETADLPPEARLKQRQRFRKLTQISSLVLGGEET